MMRNHFFVLQNLLQSARAEYITQRGRSQQARRELSILDIRDRRDRIAHSEIAHSIDSDGHRVLGEYLLRRHVECDRAQVDVYDRVYARQDKEEAWAFGTSRQDPAKAQNNCSLVFFHNLFWWWLAC